MTIFKEGDSVRVLPNPYNITDRRVGYIGTVTRVDIASLILPVRIEYQTGDYNWTNFESLELVKAAPAPSQHSIIGAEILDKMVELKASIVTRDEAVKLVVDQTEALDALLAQYGLKRGEPVPAIPVKVAAGPRTALDDVADKIIREGMKYRCTSTDSSYFTEGEVYKVSELDESDNYQPVAFTDDDGDDYYPDRFELASFIRTL